ncbi:unnamed protein product, partial [Ectocarpus sp. 12 AP-2014]
MRSDLVDGLSDFRREVKAVLDTALCETDTPLAVGDLRPGDRPGPRLAPNPRTSGGNGAKSASRRVGTVDGTVANDMS